MEKKKPDLARATAFVRFLHAFQAVERVVACHDLSRRENDVEHSYFLAMLCWYLVDALELEYSIEKILKYALAHDVVEVYAGDSYFLDAATREKKKEREENARIRVAGEFPEFNNLHETIESYECRSDPEAVFVYTVDKLLPFITNYLQGGHMWKEMQVAHEEVYANKREKIGEHEVVRDLLEQIITVIGDDWAAYFVA